MPAGRRAADCIGLDDASTAPSIAAMNPTANRCHSCTMPIEAGTLCQYCGDEHGKLRPFAELFERMVQWTQTQAPGTARAEAERQTIAFMAQQPAWRDDPQVKARARKS
jgi:hypothetical protein